MPAIGYAVSKSQLKPSVCHAITVSMRKSAAAAHREVKSRLCLVLPDKMNGKFVMQAAKSRLEKTIQNQLNVWFIAKLQIKQGITAHA